MASSSDSLKCPWIPHEIRHSPGPILPQTPDVIALQNELKQKRADDRLKKEKERQEDLAAKNEACRLHNERKEAELSIKRKRNELAMENLIANRKKKRTK
jgi:hypothetical protein